MQFAKLFLDGSIGIPTWATIKKPQLEDRTVDFKPHEMVTHLSGVTKSQYVEIGFNPIRDEFELVCMNYFFYNYFSDFNTFYRKMILIIMQKQY